MLEDKVAKLLAELETIEQKLAQPDATRDAKTFKELSKDYVRLGKIKNVYQELAKTKKNLSENKTLLQSETDPELRELIEEEIPLLEEATATLQQKLETLLVPPDPNDSANTLVEVRAGTGGDEAALFCGDCVRMYQLFADHMGWKTEKLSAQPSDQGGYKEFVMVISGENAYRFLQHEAGTHRVQRVPDTETQGRLHTSAITVAVLMEPGEDETVVIDEKDLRIDTMRASGAGGQHVNTTDSAVRITHLPTGIVAACQEERSQHKNKDKAMRVLKAKLQEAKRLEQQKNLSSTRQGQVGSGDRSERIRTYNFPQNRVTDHRNNFTSHDLTGILNGKLLPLSEALVQFFYTQKLTS